MNWQSFITLIQEPSESSFFVSNTRNHDQIGKILCGLLNTNGGILVIGYDKVNVHLTGYNESDEWINQFISENFNNTLSITSAFLFRSNKKVLILEVIKSEQIQSYKNQFFHITNKRIEMFEPQKNPAYNFNISSPTTIHTQTDIQVIPKKQPIVHKETSVSADHLD
ncbi:MAG: ATP-binding protein, partial [Candidatus Margulisiibacteriota bacterium]|nr:ATP-binding protein [Candidatus Margulisiibacteriota bacterium]